MSVTLKLKISVTENDLKNGNCQNPHSCPVALALNRTGFDDVAVMAHVIYVNKKEPVIELGKLVKYEFKQYFAKPDPITSSRISKLTDGRYWLVPPWSFELELKPFTDGAWKYDL